MKISIIIPVYNSEKSLEKLNNEIDIFFINRKENYEKIYINDCSLDSSINILKDIYKSDKEQVKVIDLKKNYGQQNAIFTGFQYATGDYIVTIDDDLQHDINSLDIMIKEILKGNDLVYGIYNNRYTNIRTLGSRMTGIFFKLNFKNLDKNHVSSYRIFSKELLNKTKTCKYKYIYISGIMLKYAERISNVSIEQRRREFGKSGYNIFKLIKIFLKLNFYYSKYVPEILKLKKENYEVKEVYS